MSLAFADDFKQVAHEEIRKTAEYISAGKCASYEEYKSKCAHIAGLKKALELFNSVAQRHGELDE